jgi:hypothetical protein
MRLTRERKHGMRSGLTSIFLVAAAALPAMPAAAADYGCGLTPRNTRGEVAALVLRNDGPAAADRRAAETGAASLRIVVCGAAGCAQPIVLGAPVPLAIGWQRDMLTVFTDAPSMRAAAATRVAFRPLGEADASALRYNLGSCRQRPSAGG